MQLMEKKNTTEFDIIETRLGDLNIEEDDIK